MRIRAPFVFVVLGLVFISEARAQDLRDELVAAYPYWTTATGRFAPVYPALAEEILTRYGVTEGICVDIGAGCGSLAIELALASDLTCYALDIDPIATLLCGVLAYDRGLMSRVRPIEGDAMDLPFRDEFADLVVSRGSIFFWPDQLQGLLEAYRILKPGGVAYIGGGFSNILDPAIRTPLAEAHAESVREGRISGWRPLEADLVQRAMDAGVAEGRYLEEPIAGWWIEMRKPAEGEEE